MLFTQLMNLCKNNSGSKNLYRRHSLDCDLKSNLFFFRNAKNTISIIHICHIVSGGPEPCGSCVTVLATTARCFSQLRGNTVDFCVFYYNVFAELRVNKWKSVCLKLKTDSVRFTES